MASVARRWRVPEPLFVCAALAAAALVAAAMAVAPPGRVPLLGVAVVLPAIAYLAWYTHPAVLLGGGIMLSVFSGNWANIGLPELVAPDRMLIVAAIGATLLRAPTIHDRPHLRLRPIHWLLYLSIVYVATSSIAAGNADKASFLKLADRIGAVPFVLFLLAPVIFTSARRRSQLLAFLVGTGLYLGITALFEAVNLDALVFPHYITNAALGIHADRARGPFLEAVGNGTALYVGIVASAIAFLTWKVRWQRGVAAFTGAVCTAGLIFTLTRSVWLGALVATVVTMVFARELRRYLLPAVVGAALVVGVSFAGIPGLADKARAREEQKESVWDRYNLNHAAINMFHARPLVGFGWNTFPEIGTDYFTLGPTYPLSAGVGFGVHNEYLSNLAELGLIGTALWLVPLVVVVFITVTRRGPPELRAWRLGILAIAVFFLVVAGFVYPYAFPVLVLWTMMGAVREPALQEGRVADAQLARGRWPDGAPTASRAHAA
jgi:putative inorganic carbon (HCO3(-)) transporter